MISAIFDLSAPDNNQANQQFALNLYLPPFAKNKLSRDTEKIIKLAEVRKQLKKIRTYLLIEESQADHLSLLLAIISSGLIDPAIKLSVFAPKGATQWQQFKLCADLSQLKELEQKQATLLIKAAGNLGHFHSKPLNTLSAIQFCRDPAYSATGEFGFTENQLSDKTASLSISGGSNAYSVYYAILITRINGLSIAEHLILENTFSTKIQTFFKTLLGKNNLANLQKNIQTALNKTASNIGDELHILDKQITLPIYKPNEKCDYINITPIINPTLFAATSRSIFYIKNQSIPFINMELGGTNPSNAGTAVGEVAGQNSRLKMIFPSSNSNHVQRIIASLNYKGCYLWQKSFKQKIISRLLQYENNPHHLPNDKRKHLLSNIIEEIIQVVQEQINEIDNYLQSLPKEQQGELLKKQYHDFFTKNKLNSNDYIIWQDTLIYSLQSIEKLVRNIEFTPIIKEIKQQFEQQIYTKGGF